jgi:hypothetical protein
MKELNTMSEKHEQLIENAPKADKYDRTHAAAKAVLSAIPVLGGALSELVNQIITPSLEKRRDAWIESIASKLIELDRTLQSLHDNDSFITAIMYASQIAIRTHEEEKLEALRNSVLNSALPTRPEDDSIHIFLNMVDILTPTHLRILNFLDSPENSLSEHHLKVRNLSYIPELSIRTLVAMAFPKYNKNNTFIDHVINELLHHGLIFEKNYNLPKKVQQLVGVGRINSELFKPYTTTFGKQFIQFISSPQRG